MTKKIILSTNVLVFAALLLAACGSPAVAESAPTAMESTAMDESMPEDSGPAMPADAVTSEGTGFCNNAFFPIRSDKTWNYNVTSVGEDADFSWTFKDISDTSFTIVQNFPGVTNEITWDCNSDGILSSDYANMAVNADVDVQYETLEVSGVSLPPADQWSVGKSWDTNYSVMVNINAQGFETQAGGNIQLNRTITAIESVTVPAGTYPEAYRVDSTGQMTLDIMGNESTTPLTYTDWYVKGVGFVRSSSTDGDLSYELELISFE